MRITGSTAQAMSKYANEISNGRVAICAVGADLGRGARVIDMNEQLVWLGEPRHAAAYYVGQIDGIRKVRGLNDALPADVRAVRLELLDDDRRPDIIGWYQRGRADGEYRAGKP